MNVFHAQYRWRGRYGAYEDMDGIVVANTKSEALDMVLGANSTTDAKDWTIYDIPLDTPRYENISSACS